MLKIDTKLKGINFRKSPYRGMLPQIAKDIGISYSALRQALYRGNLDIIEAVLKRAQELNEQRNSQVRRVSELAKQVTRI